MKGKIHSESVMVKAVKEYENGIKAEEICRKLGIVPKTLYKWRTKYGGMELSQVKRLKELEEENRKLKQMYADLALDNQILRDVIEKTIEPEVKKEIVAEIIVEYEVSISRACRLMEIHRSYYYYREKKTTGRLRKPSAGPLSMETAFGRYSIVCGAMASPGIIRKYTAFIRLCITKKE